MYTVTRNEKSIRVTNTTGNQSFTIILVNKKIELHRNIEGKDAKHAAALQTAIRSILVKKLSKKLAWSARFDKVGKILDEIGACPTLHVMSNSFARIAAEKFPA